MMVVIALPEGVVPVEALPLTLDGQKPIYSYKHAVIVQNTLHHDFKIEVRKRRAIFNWLPLFLFFVVVLCLLSFWLFVCLFICFVLFFVFVFFYRFL